MKLFTIELGQSQKSCNTYIFSRFFAKVKVDSYDSCEKRLTLHNIIIHIKSVLNKDKNDYYCKIFLEKCSYQLAKRPIKTWDVNVDNIVISKLVRTSTNSKYLIGYLDKTIRPVVLKLK